MAGASIVLPFQSAHAATPTVSLWTIAGGVKTPAASGRVGSKLVIAGTGFDPGSVVTITSTVGSVTVDWLTAGTCPVTGGGTGSADSLATSSSGTCLTTSAGADFEVTTTVPAMPGGVQTIEVSDGVNSVGASFTITPSLNLTVGTGDLNYGFPEQNIGSPNADVFSLTGFGASEVVALSTSVFTSASLSVTSCTTSTMGSCSFSDSLVVADQTGGSKPITATGNASALTASTTYTVRPWVAFYNSVSGPTSFSFLGTAPTSILIEAHGLPEGTIPANSITIGGVGTDHQAVTVGPSGAFAGEGGQLVVAPRANVPYGPVSVVDGGTTFSYAQGNIALGAGTWGGVLISSIPGTISSTAVVTADASSYKPGTGFAVSSTSPAPAQNQVAFFGYGFIPGNAVFLAAPAGASFTPIRPPGTSDASGAFFSTQAIGDTPWSSAATPTVPASYTVVVSQAPTLPANILNPSFIITPWIQAQTTTRIDYTDGGFSVTAHGFSQSETVTAAIGGSPMLSGGTCTTTTAGTCVTQPGKVPDLASGLQSVRATGTLSGVSVTGSTIAAGAVTYDPVADFTGGRTLSIDVGVTGTTTILRTGNGYGVHGLLANTVYHVIWNAVSGTMTVGSFTSTSTGGVPSPGVQFTIPSDVGGIHILDLQTTSGASALYDGQVLGEVAPPEAPFSSTLITAYGDMLFQTVAWVQAAPSVASVGAPETLTGSGLGAGQSYVVALGYAPGQVLLNAPALGTFTSTSSGTVPAGVTITLPETPTVVETGTVEYFSIQTAAHFGVTTFSDAYAEFVLAASAQDNTSAAPAGHSVTFTAHALNPGAIYDLIFNYVQNPISSNSYSGVTVGVLAPNSVGTGSINWNVPANTPAGTYVVQLTVAAQGINGALVGAAVLDVPLTFTVGSVSTTSVSCSPPSMVAGSSSTCTATVTGASPTGTVTWNSSSATGGFSSGGTCTLASGSCFVDYTDTAPGAAIITATYGGDASNTGSSDSVGLAVTLRSSSTTVSCAKPFHRGAPITCTATVVDTSPGAPITPSGTVTFSANRAGSFSSATCTLSGSGGTASCAVTFAPSKLLLYKMVASYGGDAAHLGSSGYRYLLVTP